MGVRPKLQDTAWTINREVLKFVEHFLRRGGLPGDRRIPPWPTEEQEERGEGESIRSRRSAGQAAFDVANLFDLRDAFWFPWRADTRGRLYTIPSSLSPLGSDLHRALLRFRDPRPLGTLEAYHWLLRHFANVAGEDKVAAEEQIAWAKAHLGEAVSVAENPIRNVALWQSKAEPWRYLAACFELARYRETTSMWDDGPNLAFECALPVELDGSCSGLQHLSLAMLDPFGAEHTNLLGGERRDIYGVVAQRLEHILDEEPGGNYQMAERWLASGLIDRSFVKRPVMATPFGISDYSVVEAIIEALEDVQISGKDPGFQPHEYTAAGRYLVKPLRQAIGAVVLKAPEAMDYLQKCVKEVVRKGHDPYWITPVGFLAYREYKKSYTKRVRTKLRGSFSLPRPRNCTVGIDGTQINAKKHGNAAAPNWTHSQDAAHLVRAVNAFADAGGGMIATIHDCFMVSAADAPMIHRILLETLADMYRGHPLEEFRQQLMDRFSVHLPPPPLQGDLDLEAVLQSGDYAFA